jgi:hypothetical protein
MWLSVTFSSLPVDRKEPALTSFWGRWSAGCRL